MFLYYLDLARRSLRRNLSLTILMIVAIAFGVGASMTMLTIKHVMSGDPLPGKSQQLFYVQLDPYKLAGRGLGEEPADQSTRRDSENLLLAAKADHQAMMTGGEAAIEPQRAGLQPFYADARWTSADFFTMFRVPFLAGASWTADDDVRSARVTVIAKSLAEKLFGSTNVVGQPLRVDGNDLRIVGVIDDWIPTPHFYDLNQESYGKAELVFVPFSTSRELKLDRSGSMNCWDAHDDSTALGAPCEWIQFWVELDSPEKLTAYRDYLVRYSAEELRVGHYQRPPNVKLRNVMEWLSYNEVVPKDVRILTWVAIGFLLVCLLNTVGLLLTKFLRRSPEIGVRRALGASKRSIFVQLLVEAGLIGLVGGVLGLGLAYLGLAAVRGQFGEHVEFIQLDFEMLVATFVIAIASSLSAGLLPAWRGCQITPAIQLKSH
jgi:putative ABC transport system permease protein